MPGENALVCRERCGPLHRMPDSPPSRHPMIQCEARLGTHPTSAIHVGLSTGTMSALQRDGRHCAAMPIISQFLIRARGPSGNTVQVAIPPKSLPSEGNEASRPLGRIRCRADIAMVPDVVECCAQCGSLPIVTTKCLQVHVLRSLYNY